MKNTLLILALFGVVAFSAACGTGQKFEIPDDVKVFVQIEREITGEIDASLKVYANDFNLNSDAENDVLLMFTCPCYLGWHNFNDHSPMVKINGQQAFSVNILPGAEYNISETRLESSEERSYYFPMKK